jgi:hypothetical protein
MALNETTLASALKGIYAEMRDSASGSPKDDDWFAEKMAKAITDQIKTAEIASGKVIVSVSGGSGAPAVGVANPAPIQVV